MNQNFSESDWKAFRRYHDEMLESLFSRINEKSSAILSASGSTPEEKYRELFDHVKTSDETIASCFSDWRRSQIAIMGLNLHCEDLIPDALWEELSESARNSIQTLREIRES